MARHVRREKGLEKGLVGAEGREEGDECDCALVSRRGGRERPVGELDANEGRKERKKARERI